MLKTLPRPATTGGKQSANGMEHELSAPGTVLSELCSSDGLKVYQSDVSEKVVTSPFQVSRP